MSVNEDDGVDKMRRKKLKGSVELDFETLARDVMRIPASSPLSSFF